MTIQRLRRWCALVRGRVNLRDHRLAEAAPMRDDAQLTTPYRKWPPAAQSDGTERRRHPRNATLNEEICYTYRFPAICPVFTEERHARCYDASRGGMFIWTYDPQPIGTLIDISLARTDCHVSARVVWHRHTTRPEVDGFPGMGVQFLDVDAATLEVLEGSFYLESPETRARRNVAHFNQAAPRVTDDRRNDARAGLSILHAFEDQDVLVRPLAAEVVRLGGCVRFDDLALRSGDSLTAWLESLNEDPRVGVLVLSPAFLREGWTPEELDTLSLRLSIDEPREGSLVLPLWHQLTRADVAERSPALADKLALKTSADLTALAAELYKLMDRFVPCNYCEYLMPKPGNPFEDRLCGDCDLRASCGNL